MATVIDLREPRRESRTRDIFRGIGSLGQSAFQLAEFKHRKKLDTTMEKHAADRNRIEQQQVDLQAGRDSLARDKAQWDLLMQPQAIFQAQNKQRVDRAKQSVTTNTAVVKNFGHLMDANETANLVNDIAQNASIVDGQRGQRADVTSADVILGRKREKAQRMIDQVNRTKRPQGDSALGRQIDFTVAGLEEILNPVNELKIGEIDSRLNAGKAFTQRQKFQIKIDLPGFLLGGKRNVSNIRVADLTKEELLIAHKNKAAYSNEQRDAIAELGLLRGWLKKAKK